MALYGFQVGGLSDDPLPCWQANENPITCCFGRAQLDLSGSNEWSQTVIFGHQPETHIEPAAFSKAMWALGVGALRRSGLAGPSPPLSKAERGDSGLARMALT